MRYQTILPASCTNLGARADEMIPKFGSPAVVFGLLNCAWLKALKNSARSSNLDDSVRRTFFWIPISQLFVPGPCIIPLPEFPK